MNYDHFLDTTKHRISVAKRILLFCQVFADWAKPRRIESVNVEKLVSKLMQRASEHDLSKFSPIEVQSFTINIPLVDAAQKRWGYESPEHKAARAALGEGLKHHYESNTHHPEHFANGIDGMNVLDIVEMLCDWWGVADAKDADVMEFIQSNAKRFGITVQLKVAMENTVRQISYIKSFELEENTPSTLFDLLVDYVDADLFSSAEGGGRGVYIPKEYNDQLKNVLLNEA